jgi:hypothetical protein
MRAIFPGRVFDLDAVRLALLLPDIFDLARIEHAARAFGGRRRLEISREFGDLFLEILQGPERGDVEHRHETSVIVPAGGFDAKAQARQQPAENFDHRGEARPLVALGAAERQQRATLAELFGIGGVPSLAVDDPPLWNFLAARSRELDLSGRDRRCRHVQIERCLEVGRHGDRDRIGAEPRLAAAERRDVFWRAAGIRGGKPDHAFPHRHHRIGGKPSDMALAEHRAGRDIGGLRFLDRQRHRPGVDVEAKTPVAVDHGRGRRLLHDGPLRAGHDMADLDPVDIGRDRDDSVGVMAREVGVDAADRHGIRLLLRRAGSPEQRRANARETVVLHHRHGVSSALSPRGRRVLLVVAAMVSKRWLEGKWQDIENRGGGRRRHGLGFPLRGIRMPCMTRKIAGPRQ